MKVKLKEARRTVNLLTDPEPGWMALVTNGANQTPMASLKSENGNRQELSDMAKGKGAKRDGVVTRFNFSKDIFPNIGDVQKWVDDQGIEGGEAAADEGDIFVVKTANLDAYGKIGKAVATPTKHDGVTAFFAERVTETEQTGDTGVDEDEEGNVTVRDLPGVAGSGDQAAHVTLPVPGASEGSPPALKAAAKAARIAAIKAGSKVKVVDGVATNVRRAALDDTDTVLRFPKVAGSNTTKYDWWGAYLSDDGNLLGVLEDGMEYDALPPGMDEVMNAVYISAGNVLSSDNGDKEALLKQIGEDFAGITFGLFELFQKATVDVDNKEASVKRRATAKAFVKSFGDSLKATKISFLPAGAVDISTPDPVVTEEPDPVLTAIADLGKQMTDGFAAIDERVSVVEEAATEATAATKTVTEALARAPTSKSLGNALEHLADNDGETAAQKANKKANSEFAEDVMRSTFGLVGNRPRQVA